MEVKQIENFKIPNAVAHEITQEELQREFDYYRAQQVLETMFLFGMNSTKYRLIIAKLSPHFWRRLWAK